MSRTKVQVVPMKVVREKDGFTEEDVYVVRELVSGTWRPKSKGYVHSTSAFAALGRLLQKQIKEELGE